MLPVLIQIKHNIKYPTEKLYKCQKLSSFYKENKKRQT